MDTVTGILRFPRIGFSEQKGVLKLTFLYGKFVFMQEVQGFLDEKIKMRNALSSVSSLELWPCIVLRIFIYLKVYYYPKFLYRIVTILIISILSTKIYIF